MWVVGDNNDPGRREIIERDAGWLLDPWLRNPEFKYAPNVFTRPTPKFPDGGSGFGYLRYYRFAFGSAPPDHPGTGRYWGRTYLVTAPAWAMILAFAVLPLLRLARRLRRRPPVGQCPTCGYDLRATPGRCPECGAVPDGGKP
jgi:hypothetical protein